MPPNYADDELRHDYDYDSDSDSGSDEDQDEQPCLTLEEWKKALTNKIPPYPPISEDRSLYFPALANRGRPHERRERNVATSSHRSTAPDASMYDDHEPDVMVETVDVDPFSDDMEIDEPLAVTIKVRNEASRSQFYFESPSTSPTKARAQFARLPSDMELRHSPRPRRRASTFFTYCDSSSPLKPHGVEVRKPWICCFPACPFRATSVEAIKHHMTTFQHGKVSPPHTWDGYDCENLADDVVMF